MAKTKLKPEDIQVGKVYTDGKTAGIKVTRVFEKFGCKMYRIETVVGKQFKSKEWTEGSLLSWAKEEVEMPQPIEMPAKEEAKDVADQHTWSTQGAETSEAEAAETVSE